MTELPWTLLGLPADLALPHLALVLASGEAFSLDHGEVDDGPQRADIRAQLIDPAIFGEPSDTDRFGHIVLHAKVVHPLVLVLAPDLLAERCGVSVEGLRQLANWQRWVVIDAASDSGVEVGSLVDEVAAEDLRDDAVELASGARAIERLLAVRGRPLACILDRVRVLPRGLRPPADTDADASKRAMSNFELVHHRVVNRAYRIRRLTELQAPEIILRNELVMIQAAVEVLFCNEAREQPTTVHRNRIVPSLLGLAGGVTLGESLSVLDSMVARSGPEMLSGALPMPLLRCVRLIQALALELIAR